MENVYISSDFNAGTINSNYMSHESLVGFSSTSDDLQMIVFSSWDTDPLSKIGDIVLPHSVKVNYDYSEEDAIWCAECKELNIVACGNSIDESKKKLEIELTDAIWLYTVKFKGRDLDPKANVLRAELEKIKELNGL
jgi:hypothetical protein